MPSFEAGAIGVVRLDRDPSVKLQARVSEISREVAQRDQIDTAFSGYISARVPSVIITLQIDVPQATAITYDRAFGTATFVTRRVRPIHFLLNQRQS